MRGNRPFLPRGVYRFKTYEELNEWTLKMLTRPTTVNDLLVLARALNERGAHYLVVGGLAINQHGLPRGTMDIDLLVDPLCRRLLSRRT